MTSSAIPAARDCTALLLAAGRGTRFDAAEGKLLQRFGADSVALAAARTLLQALPVLAVVAAEGELARSLRACGCEVALLAPDAPREMSASLRRALEARRDDRGWVVALADMPLLRADTVTRIAAALHAGAGIAAPVIQGRRGHPVGFSRVHLDALLALRGDRGARALLETHPVSEVEVDDAGIFADIDTPADLERLRPR